MQWRTKSGDPVQHKSLADGGGGDVGQRYSFQPSRMRINDSQEVSRLFRFWGVKRSDDVHMDVSEPVCRKRQVFDGLFRVATDLSLLAGNAFNAPFFYILLHAWPEISCVDQPNGRFDPRMAKIVERVKHD